MEGSPPSKQKISNDSNHSIQIIQITLIIRYFISVKASVHIQLTNSLTQEQTTQQHKNIHKGIAF